jgi:hypothetical protein
LEVLNVLKLDLLLMQLMEKGFTMPAQLASINQQ